jgi:hypothetical protein
MGSQQWSRDLAGLEKAIQRKFAMHGASYSSYFVRVFASQTDQLLRERKERGREFYFHSSPTCCLEIFPVQIGYACLFSTTGLFAGGKRIMGLNYGSRSQSHNYHLGIV